MRFINKLACRLWDHLGPEPAYESGQAFVGQVLVMAPIAIPVALGITVLILTG